MDLRTFARKITQVKAGGRHRFCHGWRGVRGGGVGVMIAVVYVWLWCSAEKTQYDRTINNWDTRAGKVRLKFKNKADR